MDYREVKVAHVKDILNGEMKNFPIDDENEILLAKVNGQFYAVEPKCTHYGAPLANGVLSGDTIVCPWHHACFNVKSGDVIEPPALNSLPSYDVKIKDDEIYVSVPQNPRPHRIPTMVEHDINDKRTYVIAGGGAAGYSAAQAMREAGFQGKIKIITPEKKTPYDRPNLSKDYLQGTAQEEWMPLRDDDFYSKYSIDFLFENSVKKIDKENKEVLLDNGGKVKFDKLLVAAGGIPKSLGIEGEKLQNVFTLRSFASCDEIIEASKDAENIAIIGSSFIGMETAYSLKERTGKSVTIIAREEVPFAKVFGEEIGKHFKKKHEEKGIAFKTGKPQKFTGEKKVSKVILENSVEIPADFVLIGIGVKPATDFLKEFSLEKDGGIKVDEFFKIAEDIYAAGDIVHFPDFYSGETLRIEHWRTALQQGRTAGFNMAGKETSFSSVPFFWTKQSSKISYTGHAKEWDEIITWGNISEENAISFYVKENKVYAVAAIGRAKELAAVQHLMRQKKMPSAKELKAGEIDLVKLCKNEKEV